MQLLRLLCMQLILFCNVINGNFTSEYIELSKNRTDLLSGKSEEISPLSSRSYGNDGHGFSLDSTSLKMLQGTKKESQHKAKTSQVRRRKGKRGKFGKSGKGGKRGRDSNFRRNRNRRPVKATTKIETILDPKKILRDTMSHMFGFDHMTVAFDSRNTDAPPIIKSTSTDSNFDIKSPTQSLYEDLDSTSDEESMPYPPNFMLELYRTYSQDKRMMFLHSKSHGNTVRSFFPSPADPRLYNRGRGKPITISSLDQPEGNDRDTSLENEDSSNTLSKNHISVFLFNLSSIPNPEEIVRADIRLDGNHKSAKNPFETENVELRSSATSSDNGNLRNDNTEAIGNRPRTTNKENNGTEESSWTLLVGVYRKERRECVEPDCHSDVSEIFTRVGRPSKLQSSPSVTVWSTQDLVKFAVKARKNDHIIVVKFQRSGGDSYQTGNEFLRRRSRHALKENEDLPNIFSVVDGERPKRNSGHKQNQLYDSTMSLDPSAFSSFSKNWFDDHLYRPPIPILIVYCNDSRTAVAQEASLTAPIIWGAIGNITDSFKSRNRRSTSADASGNALSPDTLDDNRLPGEESNANDSEENDELKRTRTQARKPVMVEKRKNSRSKFSGKESSAKSQTSLQGNHTINRPSKRNRKKRKGKKCSEKRGRQRKCRRKPQHIMSLAGKNRHNESCGRKTLPVNFADIGWSEWIISPKYFDAYYCTGRCELREMRESNPSNHAIIQALMKSLRTYKDLPAPCCVPEKLMSLSVLFFDASRNVVLKVYPNMSVETCACR